MQNKKAAVVVVKLYVFAVAVGCCSGCRCCCFCCCTLHINFVIFDVRIVVVNLIFKIKSSLFTISHNVVVVAAVEEAITDA